MVPNRHLDSLQESDLKHLVLNVKRHYKLFIGCLLFALSLAYLVNILMVPKYKVSSSLLITEEKKINKGKTSEFLNSDLFSLNQNLQNELWMLKSVPTINQTIKNLNLTVQYGQKSLVPKDMYGKVPFKVVLLPSHVQPVNVKFNIKFIGNDKFEIEAKRKLVSFVDFDNGELVKEVNNWSFKKRAKFDELIEAEDLGFVVVKSEDVPLEKHFKDQYSFLFIDPISATNNLKKDLQFKIVDKLATVIEISYKTTSVKKGKDIVNEIMSVYSQQNLEQKNHLASITIDYIDQQLSEISDSLSTTEQDLQRFRSSNHLINVTEQANTISNQYMDLQNQYAELLTRKRYYDYVYNYLSENSDYSNMIVPASMGIPDQLLNNLMSELISAQTQRLNLIQNNQENNPIVQKLNVNIENIKATIFNNISAVRKTIGLSVSEMDKRIKKMELTISRLPVTQRKLGGLERKYKLNDAIYNYLLEKRAEAKITLASNVPDNVIIEPARLLGRKPVSPNTQLNYLIAVVLGLVVPIGFLTVKSVLNTRLDSLDSIERLTTAPVFGKIMHNRKKCKNGLYEPPSTIVIESFRALRTNIQFQFKDLSHKVIMVTSCIEGEGKSFNSLNLAMSYAQLGHRTIIINFDLRKPRQYFSEEEKLYRGT